MLADALHKRFAKRFCEVWFGFKPMRQFNSLQLREIVTLLQQFPLVAGGS